ncbi:Neuropilin and tolloid-like protein 2 [Araneus ventricosus]|uniref:Neuropilin and tolloid-like protein 2 n=1 Tax=Araneus ventricosus TaxID=182803 RepID=A0A4Y2UNY9_ARAVE|nr:Neuropilin and tolloid-like protein 2 [Araneus ventricosus]
MTYRVLIRKTPYEPKPRSGRPRVTDIHSDRRIQRMASSQKMAVREITGASQLQISKNTVHKRIMESAPHGHVIQLDFREVFHLEESPTCEYDWLEIRNGPHGYSPLIKKFCGHEFPPMLTSKDQFLWLKFSSDDSIEYEGFKAIFKFLPIKSKTLFLFLKSHCIVVDATVINTLFR